MLSSPESLLLARWLPGLKPRSFIHLSPFLNYSESITSPLSVYPFSSHTSPNTEFSPHSGHPSLPRDCLCVSGLSLCQLKRQSCLSFSPPCSSSQRPLRFTTSQLGGFFLKTLIKSIFTFSFSPF